MATRVAAPGGARGGTGSCRACGTPGRLRQPQLHDLVQQEAGQAAEVLVLGARLPEQPDPHHLAALDDVEAGLLDVAGVLRHHPLRPVLRVHARDAGVAVHAGPVPAVDGHGAGLRPRARLHELALRCRAGQVDDALHDDLAVLLRGAPQVEERRAAGGARQDALEPALELRLHLLLRRHGPLEPRVLGDLPDAEAVPGLHHKDLAEQVLGAVLALLEEAVAGVRLHELRGDRGPELAGLEHGHAAVLAHGDLEHLPHGGHQEHVQQDDAGRPQVHRLAVRVEGLLVAARHVLGRAHVVAHLRQRPVVDQLQGGPGHHEVLVLDVAVVVRRLPLRGVVQGHQQGDDLPEEEAGLRLVEGAALQPPGLLRDDNVVEQLPAVAVLRDDAVEAGPLLPGRGHLDERVAGHLEHGHDVLVVHEVLHLGNALRDLQLLHHLGHDGVGARRELLFALERLDEHLLPGLQVHCTPAMAEPSRHDVSVQAVLPRNLRPHQQLAGAAGHRPAVHPCALPAKQRGGQAWVLVAGQADVELTDDQLVGQEHNLCQHRPHVCVVGMHQRQQVLGVGPFLGNLMVNLHSNILEQFGCRLNRLNLHGLESHLNKLLSTVYEGRRVTARTQPLNHGSHQPLVDITADSGCRRA
mmetsp:Transcript_67725/g.113717  ORF Transcript_67725/g.113717 Transcript_67725/m.113717 type:complete len:638 (-) Transcript_67725:979-2892(-)